MALGVRLKTSDSKRPKFSGGRSGEKRRAEPFARRKQNGSRDNSEGQNGRRGQATVAKTNTKRSFLDEDDSGTYEGERGRTRLLRGPSVKRVAAPGSKRMGSRKPVEPSAGKFKPRGSSAAGDASRESLRFRGNEKWKKERNAADAKVDDDGASEKSVEEDKDDKADPAVRQRRVRVQSRVLDRTGKKVRVNRKALSERQGSGDAESRPKKKKRVIKIDPYDTSNKRLDDSITVHNEKVVEEKAEISKNAQFRAIQPSPAILSFVEDNLLGRRRLVELQNAGYNVKLSAPLDNVAFSTCTERERIEESVFRNKLEFFAAAKISSSFPAPLIPEIAFAGRSNVGKSSLLNALTRQWGVARTSDKPGLTQTINFFRLASKLCLVDLPGYGFAYAKDEVKESWEELVKEYVSTRVGLQQVCLLIDTKWGMKPRDHELVELMEKSQTPYQIVLTKTDLVFPIDVARRAMQIQEDLKSNKSAVNPVMMISSKSGCGIRNLRTVLAKLARFVKP